MLGTLLPLHSSTAHRNTNLSNKAILAVKSRFRLTECVAYLSIEHAPPSRGAQHRCDSDGYRLEVLGGEVRGDLFLPHELLHLQRGAGSESGGALS